MDSLSIQNYMSGASQEYQTLLGQKKRVQQSGESAEKTGVEKDDPAPVAEPSEAQASEAQALPQLNSVFEAWRLVGVVQAQVLSSPPVRLAETQPVAKPQLVAATYA